MNKRSPLFMRAIIFLFILGVLFQRASLFMQVLGTEKSDPDRRNCLYFSLPKNTVDCLFIGSSHVYSSYIPQQIFEETGIVSAGLATSSQSFQNMYWLLKESLRYQTPKVVVMDIHSVTSVVDEEVRNFRLHFSSGISVMPDLSWNKINAFYDIKNTGGGWASNLTMYDAVGFFEYKNEYEREQISLHEIKNLLFCPAKEYHTFGYYPSETVYPMEKLIPNIQTDHYFDFKATIEYEYLNKINQMLTEHGIQLLMVRAPYSHPEFDDYHLYEQAQEWVAENGIDYIDYFTLVDEIDLNLATDFRDQDHLNYLGAKKTTTHLQTYLKQNYGLADHRNDSKYKLWSQNSFDYATVEKTLLEIIEQDKQVQE